MLVFKNEVGWEVVDISCDGCWLVLVKVNMMVDFDVYLVDFRSGEIRYIILYLGVVEYVLQDFMFDSCEFLMISNDGGEFVCVVVYDIVSGKMCEVECVEWDVVYIVFLKDGYYCVIGINVDVSIVLCLYCDGQFIVLFKLFGGEVCGVVFLCSGRCMVFYVNGDCLFNNFFVVDVGFSVVLRQFMQSLFKDIDFGELVDVFIVCFKSFDGMVIFLVFMLFKEVLVQYKVLVFVFVYGGFGGQMMCGYLVLM